MYTKLTDLGKKFITDVCNANGSALLDGKNGILSYCQPPSTDVTWYSHAKFKGVAIADNRGLGLALINWFDYYGDIFQMDANIIAAQAYVESSYNVWWYQEKSIASGIAQIKTPNIYTIIVNNKYAEKELYRFTTEEIAAITKNWVGNINDANTYDVEFDAGRTNRATLHQNIIDNPEIMIKAQYCYMKFISTKCKGIASSTLFGYNMGNEVAFPSYSRSIAAAKNKYGNDYELKGINYVYDVFRILGDKENDSKHGYFGYEEKVKWKEQFDKYLAEVAESEINGVKTTDYGKYYIAGFPYPPNYKLTKHLMYYDAISMNAILNPQYPERKNYDNTPTQQSLDNLINIGNKIYDPLCDFIGFKITVTSAYRGAYLNNDVDGSENSQHRIGEALDIDTVPNRNSELFYYIANNLNFDQLIWEIGDANNPQWVHVSLKKTGVNRKKITIYNPSWLDTYQDTYTVAQFNTLKAKLYPTG